MILFNKLLSSKKGSKQLPTKCDCLFLKFVPHGRGQHKFNSLTSKILYKTRKQCQLMNLLGNFLCGPKETAPLLKSQECKDYGRRSRIPKFSVKCSKHRTYTFHTHLEVLWKGLYELDRRDYNMSSFYRPNWTNHVLAHAHNTNILSVLIF